MKASVFAISAVVCGFLLASSRIGLGQDANTGSKLQVHVSYSGTGAVDDKHKIYVIVGFAGFCEGRRHGAVCNAIGIIER